MKRSMRFGLATSLRMPMSFDPARLIADLDRLAAVPMSYLPNQSGGWGGVSLVGQEGRFDLLHCAGDSYQPTEILQRCPYFHEILDGVPCVKLSVRVLTLPPGARIFEHYDPDWSLDGGTVRLHIPIVTHDDVVFVIAGQRVRWPVGELWYGDFSFPHYACNRSPVARVHLVMDLVVNDFIRALFPPGYENGAPYRRIYRKAQCYLCDRRTRFKERVRDLLQVGRTENRPWQPRRGPSRPQEAGRAPPAQRCRDRFG